METGARLRRAVDNHRVSVAYDPLWGTLGRVYAGREISLQVAMSCGA